MQDFESDSGRQWVWMFETNETFKEKDIESATMFYSAYWCQFRICKFTVQDFEEKYCVKISFLGPICVFSCRKGVPVD